MNELSNDDAETIRILYMAEIQTKHMPEALALEPSLVAVSK
jgi:hypothetical protein